MADSASRIEQFKKMATDDPNNELGHFSLGRAYLDAGNVTEAASSLQRCLALNPKLSKAYQLLATALLKLGQKDQAIEQLTTGVTIAHERGDVMPKNDMMRQLKELGAPVPELKSSEVEQPIGQGQVHCQRCGKVGRKLPSAPFSNAQGQEIFAKICADCWREWIGMGTKVINELRLPLNDPKAQKIFDQHMMEFLNLR
jgi:Fe-S cluster biosynthesis and repair protein YggX